VAGDWPSVFNQRYGEVDEMTVQAWDLDPVAMTGRTSTATGWRCTRSSA
jgi:hypothetical protein